MALELFFPQLRGTGYTITSPATPAYNCIAWAAGVTDDWWWPDPMGVSAWPPAAPRAETMEAFLIAFEGLGYTRCDDAALEPGFEKVALYALDGVPTLTSHTASFAETGSACPFGARLRDGKPSCLSLSVGLEVLQPSFRLPLGPGVPPLPARPA